MSLAWGRIIYYILNYCQEYCLMIKLFVKLSSAVISNWTKKVSTLFKTKRSSLVLSSMRALFRSFPKSVCGRSFFLDFVSNELNCHSWTAACFPFFLKVINYSSWKESPPLWQKAFFDCAFSSFQLWVMISSFLTEFESITAIMDNSSDSPLSRLRRTKY